MSNDQPYPPQPPVDPYATAASQPPTGPSYPGQPDPGQQPPAPGQPYPGQAPYGQAPYPGQVPSAGQAPYPGQAPSAGQAPYPGQAPYGQAPYGQQPYPGQAPYPGQPYPYAAAVDPYAKSKLVAGLLGIFLGSFGIHRFYLGFTGIGIIQIVVTIVTLGVGGLWGFIEGIVYLAANRGSFTVDAQGRPLRP